ncbi:MAG: 2'-5' RNA ligase family protein [Streptosporangiaceae bacterium]|nr:2'-5' RNA ligase family protein [Streptosporangiaceae bacterium]
MTWADNVNAPSSAGSADRERFRTLRWLHDHWSRPIGRPAYYWYLTFGSSLELHRIVRICQEAIAFPYYDLLPIQDLHLTLDRIAFAGDITPDRLDAIRTTAARTCRQIQPFKITIDSLGGTPGAIGLTVSPAEPILHLRDTLRAATLSVCPDAPIRHSFHPHVTIAYANSDGIPAAEVISAVEKLNSTTHVDILIREGTLVLLERYNRSYTWQVISRIPLTG